MYVHIKTCARACLVAQWLRISLPIQGTQAQSLVQKDTTCRKATKPLGPQLLSLRSRAREPQQEKPLQWEALTRQLESSPCSLKLEKVMKTQHSQR